MADNLVEIRWHGRGGQGAKTASLLLADAAFNTGKYIQGFPEYGPERMGAPITAYNRISNKPITIHSNIYYPDFVVVVDDTLLESVDVTSGLKEDGGIIINTTKSSEEIKELLKKQKKTKYWFVKNMEGGYQSLTRLMNNETSSIKFETLEKMCDIFNCEISDIVVRKKGRKRK